MSDMHDTDPEETAKVLRAAKEKREALWANKVASAEVTPAMIVHRDGLWCVCDSCDAARVKHALPIVLRNTNHRRVVGRGELVRRKVALAIGPPDASVGSPPRPRYNKVVLNAPIRARFSNKWM